jgi:hypothetical protein
MRAADRPGFCLASKPKRLLCKNPLRISQDARALGEFERPVDIGFRYFQLVRTAVQVVDDLVNPSDVFLMLFDLDKKTLICESHRGNPLIRRQKPQLRITGSVKDLLDSGWEILGPDLRHTDRFYLYLDPELENQACIEFRIPLFLDESIWRSCCWAKRRMERLYGS